MRSADLHEKADFFLDPDHHIVAWIEPHSIMDYQWQVRVNSLAQTKSAGYSGHTFTRSRARRTAARWIRASRT